MISCKLLAYLHPAHVDSPFFFLMFPDLSSPDLANLVCDVVITDGDDGQNYQDKTLVAINQNNP